MRGARGVLGAKAPQTKHLHIFGARASVETAGIDPRPRPGNPPSPLSTQRPLACPESVRGTPSRPIAIRAAKRKSRPVRRLPESPLSDSNRRPLPYHGSALPTELRGQKACKSTSSSRQGPGRARLPYCRGTAHGVRKRCGQRVHAGLSVDGTAPGQRSLWRTRFLLAVVVSRCMEERCRGGRRMPSCRATPRHLLGSSRELLVTGGPSGGGA
jgi:hypothetical protein